VTARLILAALAGVVLAVLPIVGGPVVRLAWLAALVVLAVTLSKVIDEWIDA
jgi:hypothetical protein